jgi:microsomal dipeptidase-like Zn-dependent dipeptidase
MALPGIVSRRRFLRSSLLSCAGLIVPGAAAAWTPRPPWPTGRRILCDLHVHAGLNEWLRESPLAVRAPAITRLASVSLNTTSASWRACHAAGIDVMAVAHFNPFDEWVSMPTDPDPEAPSHTLRMLDQLEDTLAGPAARYARLARDPATLEALLAVPRGDPRFRIAVLHTLEGAHALGGSLDSLPRFARRGVAIVTLTHFFDKGVASSANAFPFFPDAGSRLPRRGLSPFGRDLIQALETLGMIADVTHASATALEDILAVARRPLVATHAAARTLGDHPYSLYDEHLQEIARHGGLIGVILYPYVLSNYASPAAARAHGSLRDVVRTIRHVVKVCGTHRVVGIGSDFSGYITGPRELRRLDRIAVLRERLLEEFDGDADLVEDILARNAIQFLRRNWRPAA